MGAPEVVGLGREWGTLQGSALYVIKWSEEHPLPGEAQRNVVPESP